MQTEPISKITNEKKDKALHLGYKKNKGTLYYLIGGFYFDSLKPSPSSH